MTFDVEDNYISNINDTRSESNNHYQQISNTNSRSNSNDEEGWKSDISSDGMCYIDNYLIDMGDEDKNYPWF